MNYDDNAELFFSSLVKKDYTRLTYANQIKVREMTKIYRFFSDKNLYSSFECVRLLYLVFNKKVPY